MNFKKNQNRRDFLISSATKGLLSGFGFFGVSLKAKSKIFAEGENCPANITCRDCFKLGVCLENKAVEMKKEIKTNIYTDKISKGANHG